MGYFGIGIFHTKTALNVGGLMRSAYCFGASFVFTVGRRYSREPMDTPDTPNQIPLYNYLTLDQLLLNLPVGCRLVGIELHPDAQSLHTYEHPARACYLLGAEDHGLPPTAISRCHELISIPNLKACLNVTTAGSLVLYSRHLQRKGSPNCV